MPALRRAGDEVYGNDPRLRADLHTRQIATSSRSHATTTSLPQRGRKAVDLVDRLPARVWARYSAGIGAKGHRVYDWALPNITEPGTPGLHAHPGAAGHPSRWPGRRWTIEESFQAGKGLAGLDEHQVRRWTSWHR